MNQSSDKEFNKIISATQYDETVALFTHYGLRHCVLLTDQSSTSVTHDEVYWSITYPTWGQSVMCEHSLSLPQLKPKILFSRGI